MKTGFGTWTLLSWWAGSRLVAPETMRCVTRILLNHWPQPTRWWWHAHASSLSETKTSSSKICLWGTRSSAEPSFSNITLRLSWDPAPGVWSPSPFLTRSVPLNWLVTFFQNKYLHLQNEDSNVLILCWNLLKGGRVTHQNPLEIFLEQCVK